jgi:hypothetical protein
MHRSLRTPEYRLDRRTMLRGLGVTLSLPWLETLAARANFLSSSEPAAAPVRFACLFSGNGFHTKEFRASGEGEQMELGAVLESLKPFRKKMNFIRGLYNAAAVNESIHSSQTGQLLSGAKLAPNGSIHSGTSVDQVMAQRLLDRTKVPSLVLGCETVLPNVHDNYSMVYSSHISWSSPTTPTPLELYPAMAFDRLFRDGPGRADMSVLDAVLEDAHSVKGRVSISDGQRIDEYLDSVREVERRLQRAGKDHHLEGFRPTLTEPNIPRPADELPQDFGEHMRLMCDILVLAFQTDTTRICTLKLNNDWSQLRFPYLGVAGDVHHLMSHKDDDDWLKINQFFVKQVAYIAERLDQIKEGDKTLLDNTMLLYLSSMLAGATHNVTELPIILLGGGGGQIAGGRILNYKEQPNRQVCRLYMSLLDKMSVEVDRFGDATEPLAEI